MSPRATERPRLRFPGVRGPQPLLSADSERRLTGRQREVISLLEKLVVEGGLASKTMAEIAAHVNCSLRTLYEIAPSRDELLLAVVDRRLRRIGRAAMDGLDPALSPMDALRAYLHAAHEALQPSTEAVSREFADVPGAARLLDAHEAYFTGITQSLLDRARAEGQIVPVDTAAVAQVLGGLGRELARPEVIPTLARPPRETADAVAEVILRGLAKT